MADTTKNTVDRQKLTYSRAGEKRIKKRRDMFKEKMSEEFLRDYRTYWIPAGSGPLGPCAVLCALIDVLAEEKGWDSVTPKEENCRVVP